MRSVRLTCLAVDIRTTPLDGTSAVRIDLAELTALNVNGGLAAHAAGGGAAGTNTGGPIGAAATATARRRKISATRGGRDWALHRVGESKEVEWRPES